MPYNKQLTNLDRSVMPGNIKLRLGHINLAIARSIDTLKPLSLIFPIMTEQSRLVSSYYFAEVIKIVTLLINRVTLNL